MDRRRTSNPGLVEDAGHPVSHEDPGHALSGRHHLAGSVGEGDDRIVHVAVFSVLDHKVAVVEGGRGEPDGHLAGAGPGLRPCRADKGSGGGDFKTFHGGLLSWGGGCLPPRFRLYPSSLSKGARRCNRPVDRTLSGGAYLRAVVLEWGKNHRDRRQESGVADF